MADLAGNLISRTSSPHRYLVHKLTHQDAHTLSLVKKVLPSHVHDRGHGYLNRFTLCKGCTALPIRYAQPPTIASGGANHTETLQTPFLPGFSTRHAKFQSCMFRRPASIFKPKPVPEPPNSRTDRPQAARCSQPPGMMPNSVQ